MVQLVLSPPLKRHSSTSFDLRTGINCMLTRLCLRHAGPWPKRYARCVRTVHVQTIFLGLGDFLCFSRGRAHSWPCIGVLDRGLNPEDIDRTSPGDGLLPHHARSTPVYQARVDPHPSSLTPFYLRFSISACRRWSSNGVTDPLARPCGAFVRGQRALRRCGTKMNLVCHGRGVYS